MPADNFQQPERKDEVMRERHIAGILNGCEQLMEAAQKGAIAQVDRLLSRGVSPECRDENRRTFTILAAENGNAGLLGVAIRHDADLNAVDNDGDTALTKAAFGGHRDVVRLLMSHGADADIRNNEGMTALEIAQQMEYDNMVDLFSSQFAGPPIPVEEKILMDPDDDGPTTDGLAGAVGSAPVAAATAASPKPRSYVQELDLEANPELETSPYFKAQQESEIVTGDGEEDAPSQSQSDGTDPAVESSGVGEQAEKAWDAIHGAVDTVLGKKTETRPFPSAGTLTADEKRIEFDALDNKQVRNTNEKVIKVLDKAGFEVGDFVIDTIDKGSFIAVLKPRSQENKRWRKLKKHPDWVIDPKRLTELRGGCAVRRFCLAEDIDVSPFGISHFIELYYVRDLKLMLTLAAEASTNKYTVRQLKRAVEELRDHKDDHDPGKEIIRTLDQSVPILEDPGLMALCTDKDRVLEELSKAERKKIRALIKERKPSLDEWKNLMDTFEGILSDLEGE